MDGFYENAHIYNTVDKLEQHWNTIRPRQVKKQFYAEKWLHQAAIFDTIWSQSRVCVTIWDAVTNRFIYALDKTGVLADNSAYFMNPDGVDFSMSHFPAGHLDAVMLMQVTAHGYYTKHRDLIPNNLVINMDSKYQVTRGLIHILQQSCVVEADENKNPLLFLSYTHDITHLKKDPSAALVLTSSREMLLYNYNFSKRKLVQARPISSQEKKVLELLSAGSHTKEIAEKLNLSRHTIDTHRRNLLSKTCCVDTTALVTYSKMVGLI